MASVEILHVAYTLVHALTSFSPKLAYFFGLSLTNFESYLVACRLTANNVSFLA